MTHKHKVKLARRMRTLTELRNGVSIFGSKAWSARKAGIAKRLLAKRKKK